MIFFSLSNLGNGGCSLNELGKFNYVKNVNLMGQSVLFELKEDFNIIDIFQKNQSLTSLNAYLSEFGKIENFSLESEEVVILIKKLFYVTGLTDLSFKLEFNGVKGQDARTELARKLYVPLISKFKELLNIELKKDFKKPDIVFQIYFTGEKYLFGLKLNQENFDSRKFRLFSHQASFKGDFAYKILDECDFVKEDKILFLFSKDSTLAIEYVFSTNHFNIRKISNKDYIWKIPHFENILNDFDSESEKEILGHKNVFAFDTASPNIRASKNNAKIAKVLDYINFKNASLEDLDIQYEKDFFDKVYVQMTKKDEANLNEIYHQSYYLIKKGGKLIFITRGTLDLIILDKFKLISEKILDRGDCSYKLSVLEKK